MIVFLIGFLVLTTVSFAALFLMYFKSFNRISDDYADELIADEQIQEIVKQMQEYIDELEAAISILEQEKEEAAHV